MTFEGIQLQGAIAIHEKFSVRMSHYSTIFETKWLNLHI